MENARAYRPRSLLLQWHITERCNLRCRHCYQDGYSGEELALERLYEILAQYKELLTGWRQESPKRRIRGHITVTGGEPFIRHDFLDLLETLAANRRCFSFAILTNGTFIDQPMARRLRQFRPAFVQVSIEGTQPTHDRIRGHGNFERTVSAIRRMVRHRIRTFISFSAHRGNYREFPAVAELGGRLRVSRVWADRVIPWGSGADLRDQVLTPAETREFIGLMRAARSHVRHGWFGRTEVAMHRALQFLANGSKPYSCTAGSSLIAVQPNGDLYPCRRMPIRVGNLMDTPLRGLYEESDLFRALRDPGRITRGCARCAYATLCRGGLKCLAYAVTGDPFECDPGCWLAKSQQTVAGDWRTA